MRKERGETLLLLFAATVDVQHAVGEARVAVTACGRGQRFRGHEEATRGVTSSGDGQSAEVAGRGAAVRGATFTTLLQVAVLDEGVAGKDDIVASWTSWLCTARTRPGSHRLSSTKNGDVAQLEVGVAAQR